MKDCSSQKKNPRVDQRIKEEGHGANLEEVCPEKAPEQVALYVRHQVGQ